MLSTPALEKLVLVEQRRVDGRFDLRLSDEMNYQMTENSQVETRMFVTKDSDASIASSSALLECDFCYAPIDLCKVELPVQTIDG